MKRVYSLSIRQPWAALLVSGLKTIEVRSWLTKIRGSILIHAAQIPDDRPEAWKWVAESIRPLTILRGGIIGKADLVDCARYDNQADFDAAQLLHLNDPSWFAAKGLHGFVFQNPSILPFRRVAGNVRFFTVEES
jgi:hypothetical protein